MFYSDWLIVSINAWQLVIPEHDSIRVRYHQIIYKGYIHSNGFYNTNGKITF